MSICRNMIKEIAINEIGRIKGIIFEIESELFLIRLKESKYMHELDKRRKFYKVRKFNILSNYLRGKYN